MIVPQALLFEDSYIFAWLGWLHFGRIRCCILCSTVVIGTRRCLVSYVVAPLTWRLSFSPAPANEHVYPIYVILLSELVSLWIWRNKELGYRIGDYPIAATKTGSSSKAHVPYPKNTMNTTVVLVTLSCPAVSFLW